VIYSSGFVLNFTQQFDMEDRLLQFARKSTGCTLRFGEEGGDANEH